MTKAEVLHLLVGKTFEQFKNKGVCIHKWTSDYKVEFLYKGKFSFKVGIRRYDYFAISDLILSVFSFIYGGKNKIVTTKKEAERLERFKDFRKISEFVIYHSTSDEDFYADIDREDFEKTICHDERELSVLLIEKS